jgi:hypothetical protein
MFIVGAKYEYINQRVFYSFDNGFTQVQKTVSLKTSENYLKSHKKKTSWRSYHKDQHKQPQFRIGMYLIFQVYVDEVS